MNTFIIRSLIRRGENSTSVNIVDVTGLTSRRPRPSFYTVYGSSGVTEAAGPALLQNTRTGYQARMASPGMGTHPIRKRGPGRSAAVERRNLLTVCR